MELIKKEYFFQDVNNLRGIGSQLTKYFKKKKIEKIKDIIFSFPYSEVDRSQIKKIDDLSIGKI